MSLFPILFGDDFARPSRILDQHFGMGLEGSDLFAPLIHPFNSMALRSSPGYYRPWRSSAAKSDVGSTVQSGKDKFQVSLDVQQFAPEEITVKVTGKNVVTVEGKHEEKQDDHGFISRHFVRRYVLPSDTDVDNVVSTLSSDGVLTITAPRVSESGEQHRTIPIQQTGQPVKNAERKGEVEEAKEAE